MFFHREFVRETNCRGEERFPVVGLSEPRLPLEKPQSILGADFPSGVANARLPLKVRDHRVHDGGTDERSHDLQQIVSQPNKLLSEII